MAEARVVSADDPGKGGLQMMLAAGPARIVADQPLEAGGLDLGPTPHELVSAGLAACATQTLRLYANLKGWPLGHVHVAVAHRKDEAQSPPDAFEVTVRLQGPLSPEQTERLLQIADHCPVHRMLAAGARVTTAVG
ncbi:OsmC family protein [Phenylobacterium sp.]|jgi:putative redox protein|uniref:OsmC family protein n=1 Tax=Phenylobacterium sp. TaxID=1871053 RepID=UPI002F3FC81C